METQLENCMESVTARLLEIPCGGAGKNKTR